MVGTLEPGDKLTLTADDPGLSGLNVAQRCNNAGAFTNVAEVTRTVATDSDPAALFCGSPPELNIEKQISIDGGVTFLDADSEATAPRVDFPSGALYQLTVQNVGAVALQNVTINAMELSPRRNYRRP